ncbi:hypothetical protein [Ferrovibrio terrae]|uniref:hypothetical protein n=1 Tax=Ferrovibrio terrae TaxID=2594003 RepID=UPI0031378B62
MSQNFFFSCYDGIDATWIAEALSCHEFISCHTGSVLPGTTAPIEQLAMTDILAAMSEWGKPLRGSIASTDVNTLWQKASATRDISNAFGVVNITSHPVRRIEILRQTYSRRFSTAAELASAAANHADWTDYLALAEMVNGGAPPPEDMPFMLALWETKRDMADFSVPVPQLPIERLRGDPDYLIAALVHVTRGLARVNPHFADAVNDRRQAAAAAADNRPVDAIIASWSSFSEAFARTVFSRRYTANLYGAAGYDITTWVGGESRRIIHYVRNSVSRTGIIERDRMAELTLLDDTTKLTDTTNLFREERIPVRRRLYNPEPIPLDFPVSVLVSIHMQSNRPEGFKAFLDALAESIDSPTNVEVVVKIDKGDDAMIALLDREIPNCPFVLKSVITDKPKDFYDLWQAKNDTLKACDPHAYFLLDMNDEQRFTKPGWDTRLKKYVGLFPDHIYRLRTSLERFKEYHDFWEPGFSNDTSAFMTRRWIGLQDDWCPCNGPDTFQEYVAYYLGRNDRHSHPRPTRNLVANDIEISFAGPSQGLSGLKLRLRLRGAIKAWFILVSHRMQQEASRRASVLDAHIYASEACLQDCYEVRDRRGKIQLYSKPQRKVIRSVPYALSWLRITAVNLYRISHYQYYGGGGLRVGRSFAANTWHILWLRFEFFAQLHLAFLDALYLVPPPIPYQHVHIQSSSHRWLVHLMRFFAIRPLRFLQRGRSTLRQAIYLFRTDRDFALRRTKRRLAMMAGRHYRLRPAEWIASSGADTASRLEDGNPGTWWLSEERGLGIKNHAWVGVRFAQPARVGSIYLTQSIMSRFRQDNIAVQYSDDGLSWQDAIPPVLLSGPLSLIEISNGPTACYWRLVALDENNDLSALSEWRPISLEFWGDHFGNHEVGTMSANARTANPSSA